MKLYQFTYTDNQSLSETRLLRRVSKFLENEGYLQGWAAGFTFRQSQKAEPLGDGSKRYFFEVSGKYLDTEGVDGDDHMKPTSGIPSNSAVARSVDI
jgi:hypothetical protein